MLILATKLIERVIIHSVTGKFDRRPLFVRQISNTECHGRISINFLVKIIKKSLQFGQIRAHLPDGIAGYALLFCFGQQPVRQWCFVGVVEDNVPGYYAPV